ncbi:MAG TPA: class I SAM-dependent methyltransferase [Desulfuromonadales bacterium]|nr:class I SAM-dependent methyltransferase [Desulfuromonadales bacterium]
MSTDFNHYTDSYRDIINRVARLSGGSYEYFVEMRLNLMRKKLLTASIKTPSSILDFGCGIGATALIMRRFFPVAHIVGVDTSHDSIAAAKELGISNAEFHCISADNRDLGTSVFDTIYSNGTFHHIALSTLPGVVSAVKTSLKPSGNLFVFENNPRNPLMLKAMRDNPFDEGVVALSAAEMQCVLMSSGFNVKCQEFYAFFPTWSGPLRACEPLLRKVPYGAQYLTWAVR